jgi:hypothetical protein
MIGIVYFILAICYRMVTMTFESAITIILTALAVMLALLAIGIAALAIWGYAGLRDSVKDAATKHVTESMQEKLQEYPEASELRALVSKMETGLGFLNQIQNQIVTSPASNSVATASKSSIKISQYPGEETQNASDSTTPTASDSGPNNSQASD